MITTETIREIRPHYTVETLNILLDMIKLEYPNDEIYYDGDRKGIVRRYEVEIINIKDV